MSGNKVQVQIYASGLHSEVVVPIGAKLLKKMGFASEETVNLQFGSARRTVKLISVPKLVGVRIHPHLAADFGISGSCVLNVRRPVGSRTLMLGPLIGVMLRKINDDKPDQLFGKNASFCAEMWEACKKYGAYAFFFTPSDIHGNNDSVSGWIMQGSRWVKQAMPVPNAVYNRLTSRVLEDSDKVQQFMKAAKEKGAHIFNEKYLHKNEVFDALSKETGLAPWLPESRPLRSAATLRSMLERHATVFLKPIKGSLGRGIIRIRRAESGYQCDSAKSNGLIRKTYATFEKLTKALGDKVKSGLYQIQQGIAIASVDGRPVDFRAVVQRGLTGEWKITSIVARIAGSRTFVSNLARGGELSTVADALAKSNVPQQLTAAVPARLRNCAIDIAKGIERQIQAHFAELGVDLAADIRGNVWLIEVNSKPSKEDNSPLVPGKIRPSVSRIVKYSLYLFRHGYKDDR